MEPYLTTALCLGIVVILLIACRRYMNGGTNKYAPRLDGKIVVITGANTGIGYVAALEMAKLMPKIIVIGARHSERVYMASQKIRKEVPGVKIYQIPLDLGDLASVKSFAKEVNEKYAKIDILLNNAGIMALPKRQTTPQGFEKQFGVNHVGHFLLTKLLLDKVKASEKGRIVTVSSLGHEKGKIHFDDLHWEKNAYDPMQAYRQSKLANVYFTRHLDTLLKKDGVTNVKVCSLHPGIVRTELGRYMFEGQPCKKCLTQVACCCFFALVTKSPEQGAQTSLHCCLIDFDKLESGAYYSDCKVKKEKMPAPSEDDDNYKRMDEDSTTWQQEASRLWTVSEEMVKDYI